MVNAKYKARAEAAEAEITALRQQLAERDAEVDRLNKQLVATTTDHDNAETRIIELEDERDAERAVVEAAIAETGSERRTDEKERKDPRAHESPGHYAEIDVARCARRAAVAALLEASKASGEGA